MSGVGSRIRALRGQLCIDSRLKGAQGYGCITEQQNGRTRGGVPIVSSSLTHRKACAQYGFRDLVLVEDRPLSRRRPHAESDPRPQEPRPPGACSGSVTVSQYQGDGQVTNTRHGT